MLRSIGLGPGGKRSDEDLEGGPAVYGRYVDEDGVTVFALQAFDFLEDVGELGVDADL